MLESGGAPADQSKHVAGEVVALALGDAYQRAILGIAEEGDGEAFARQIEAAVQYGLSRPLNPGRSPTSEARRLSTTPRRHPLAYSSQFTDLRVALPPSTRAIVMYFVVQSTPPSRTAFQLGGATLGKGACRMSCDSWTHDDLAGQSRSGNKDERSGRY